MGVVQRQGLKRSILTYLGVGIGALSTLFIYPLELEAFGLVQFLINTGAFFATFAALGVSALPVRFFPVFEHPEKRHHGFLGLLLLAAFVAMSVFWLLVWLFKGELYRFIAWIGFDLLLFEQNMPFVILIAVALAYSSLLEAYTSNFKRVAIPSIFTNLFLKIGLPVIIFFLFKGWISEIGMKWVLVFLYAAVVLALAFYLRFLGEWNVRLAPQFLNRVLLKDMTNYALFGILGSIGAVIAFRIDTIMVTSLIGTLNSGIYNVANFIANVIEIPFNAVLVILLPILSKAMAQKEMGEVRQYYRKTSINLMILGLLFYILAVTCMDDLFKITPRYDELSKGSTVVWYLGLAKVMVMAGGISGYILILSKFYRWNLFPLLFLAVVNVAMNFILIPRYQIAGAALATAISIFAYQVLNILLVWWHLRIHPFSKGMIPVLGLTVVAILLGQWVPATAYPLLNIALKGALVSVVFMGPVLFFRISPDLNDFLLKNMEKVRRLLGFS